MTRHKSMKNHQQYFMYAFVVMFVDVVVVLFSFFSFFSFVITFQKICFNIFRYEFCCCC